MEENWFDTLDELERETIECVSTGRVSDYFTCKYSSGFNNCDAFQRAQSISSTCCYNKCPEYGICENCFGYGYEKYGSCNICIRKK